MLASTMNSSPLQRVSLMDVGRSYQPCPLSGSPRALAKTWSKLSLATAQLKAAPSWNWTFSRSVKVMVSMLLASAAAAQDHRMEERGGVWPEWWAGESRGWVRVVGG